MRWETMSFGMKPEEKKMEKESTMSLVSYWESDKGAIERYNEEEMLQNLIGSKPLSEVKFPLS